MPESTPKLKPREIFISHDAIGDEPIVDLFQDLLQTGLELSTKEVFCTSQKGQGVTIGKSFIADIRQQLVDAKCVIALLTENYWSRPFCTAELGAVWYDAKKTFIPILVPPLDYKDLEGVVTGAEALKLHVDEDLDRLRDAIEGLFGRRTNTPHWNKKKKQFLENLPARIKKCPSRAPIPREKYEKSEATLKEYEEEVDRLGEEIETLAAQISELKSLKDAAGVAKVTKKYTKVGDQFEDLVDAVKKSLKPLHSVAVDVLYEEHGRGLEAFRPDGDYDWKALNDAEKEGFISDGGDGWHPRNSNKRIAAAIEALGALHKWLGSDPKGFEEWYAAEYDNEEPAMSLWPFWQRHFDA